MTGKELKSTLKNGGRIYGSAIVSPSPHWPGAVGQAGLDFVFLDLEHTAWSRDKLAQMCVVYASLGLPPIVRTPSPDPFEASKALDGGAVGILAPYIETVDQLQALVGAVKYKPLKGEKLQQVLQGKIRLAPAMQKYTASRNENNILLINVESVPAFDNLDALLAVPGLDGIIIGPHDLSCSMGIPEEYQNDEFKQTVNEIIKRARARKIAVGIHFSETAQVQIDWVQLGVNIIMHSSDISIYSRALKNDIAEIRTAFGDEITGKGGPEMII
ncbi:MAG: aldolase [Calditrichaeota bacterium]|nr:MAG: aldolase [Calditrichota bacterium]